MFIASDDYLNKISDTAVIILDNKKLKRVRMRKFLGVHVDEELSWTDPVDAASNKVSSVKGGLRHNRQFINKETATKIYNSLMEPFFDYCEIVWDNIGVLLATRLQKLNNRAGRTIRRQGYEIRSSNIRRQLGWTTLDKRRLNHKCILMYKILHEMPPTHLKQHFRYFNDITGYFLGGKRNLILSKLKTEFVKKSFRFSGAEYGIV